MPNRRDLLRDISSDSTIFQDFMDASESAFDEIMWQKYLTPELQLDLDWKAIVSKLKAVPMASIIDFESGKPVTAKQAQAVAAGELETMGNLWQMSKRDYLRYMSFLNSPLMPTDQQMIRLFFGDLNDAVTGPNKRIDYMLFQSMSTGTLAITKDNNPNGKPSEAIDWGITKTGVSATWDNAGATPLSDINAGVEVMRAKNVMIKEVVLNQFTYNQMMKTNEVIQSLGGRIQSGSKTITASGLGVNLADLNSFVTDRYGYVFTVNNDLFTTQEGVQMKGFEDSRVLLKPEGAIGQMAYMIPVELSQDTQNSNWAYSFSNYVMVKKKEEDGKSFTENEMNAYPIITMPDSMYILKTDEVA